MCSFVFTFTFCFVTGMFTERLFILVLLISRSPLALSLPIPVSLPCLPSSTSKSPFRRELVSSNPGIHLVSRKHCLLPGGKKKKKPNRTKSKTLEDATLHFRGQCLIHQKTGKIRERIREINVLLVSWSF